MSNDPREVPGPDRGFSLLELLIAVAIAGVLGLIVFILVRTLRDVQQAQRGEEEGPAAVTAAALQLSSDLTCGFPADADEAKLWLTTTNSTGLVASLLRMTVYNPSPGEEDLRWAEPVQVEWRILPNAAGTADLARISHVLAGPRAGDPAVTNRMVSPLSIFDVRFSDGKELVAEWSPRDQKTSPQFAEFRMARAPEEEQAAIHKIPCPAGTKIPRTRGNAGSPRAGIPQN